MIVVDEYLVLRVITSDAPIAGLPDDEVLGLTYLRYWRILSKIANPDRGQISEQLTNLDPSIQRLIETPPSELLRIVDPIRLAASAARLLTVLGNTSALMAETIAACMDAKSPFYVGNPQNAVGALAAQFDLAGVDIILID